jgi:hypothetical protein
MALNPDDVRQQLRHYLLTELIRKPKLQLGDSDPIITAGLIRSFDLAMLGVYVEEAFNVYIPDPDLTVAKMNTLDQMVARVLQG